MLGGCWDEFMGCHVMMHHACIMHASCNMHVIDMSLTLATGGEIMEEGRSHGMTPNRGKMNITEKDTLGFLTHPSMQQCVAHVRSTVLP